MDIGKRLRQLREAKGLSQNAIQQKTGLFRNCISRVENGHTNPSLPVLERLADAMKVRLPELFEGGSGKSEVPRLPERNPIGSQEQTLLALFSQIPPEDKALLISLAREMVDLKGNLGEAEKGGTEF